MRPDQLEAAAALVAAIAAAGLVAWLLWMTWMYVHVPRRDPEPPDRPRTRPECWRPRGDWRSRCDAP